MEPAALVNSRRKHISYDWNECCFVVGHNVLRLKRWRKLLDEFKEGTVSDLGLRFHERITDWEQL